MSARAYQKYNIFLSRERKGKIRHITGPVKETVEDDWIQTAVSKTGSLTFLILHFSRKSSDRERSYGVVDCSKRICHFF